jgi:hypothetical protein
MPRGSAPRDTPAVKGARVPGLLRFDVFGTLVGIERRDGSWQAYYLGTEGKRRPADFVVPEFVEEAELARYLADLFHEAARPGHAEVRRLS